MMYTGNLFTSDNVQALFSGGDSCVAVDAAGLAVLPGDVVFVSAMQFGRSLLETSLTGLGGMAEVMQALRVLLAHTTGLVTVRLRNRDRGWTCKRAVRVNHAVAMMPRH